MKSEWILTRLGDLISLKGGLSYKGTFIGKGDSILVGMGSVSHSDKFIESGIKKYGGEFREQHRLLPGDIVIATRQQSDNLPILGFPAMVPSSFEGKDVIVATNLWKVFNQSEVDNRFLFWLLRSDEYRRHIVSCSKGTTVRMITKDAVENFHFYCPPLQQRISITEQLDQIDNKIQLNHQINQTLEQMAQAIFKSWFVDFEPVKAKIAALEAGGREEDALLAAMQAISGEGEAEITRLQSEQPEQYAELRATAELFPSAMQDSELGEIPEGWGVNQIGDLVTRIPVGKKYSKKTASETGDVPVLDQGKSGIIGYHNEKPGVTACPDDPVIVFANHTCYMRLIMHDFSAIQNVLPFKSKPAKALNIFWLYFATHGKQEFIEYKGHWPDFVIKEIVVPDDSIASRFGSIAKDLVVNQFRNEKQNETLSAIRDAMLPKLLSGELSVTDVANQTEGAEGAVNV